MVKEGEYGASTVCVYMYINVKMIPVEMIPGMGGEEGDKEEWWRGELKYDIFDRRTFVSATMYPYPAQR
jgi:hypothetical protein